MRSNNVQQSFSNRQIREYRALIVYFQKRPRSYIQSVRLSDYSSHLFCYDHRIIINFSGVIIIDRRDVHAKGQGQRSKVKVTEVKTRFSYISCYPSVRHIIADAHSPMRLVCTLEWSHSDHCSVCLITSKND